MMNHGEQNALMIDVSPCCVIAVYLAIAKHEDRTMRKLGKSWEAQLVDGELHHRPEFSSGKEGLEV
jgi:hypothetical protein